MDLIDFQSCPDGEFKWLLVYQDHFTKMVQLRPLKSKCAIEVARALIDIFTIFGVPAILQSDNGKEFRNQVVRALKEIWPDMNFVMNSVTNGQAKQAKMMLTRSGKYLGECEIGDYVTLPIPQVDRSISSAPNLICRIVDIDYRYSMYELACEAGVLNILFARNCFEKLESKVLDVKISLEKALSVREAASAVDIGGGQGMVKCN